LLDGVPDENQFIDALLAIGKALDARYDSRLASPGGAW
jgi:hypothetical protein